MFIEPSNNPRIEFSGKDLKGDSVTSASHLASSFFEELRDLFAGGLRKTVARTERKLAEIPNAKIITVDFRNKKIDPDRRPIPQVLDKPDVPPYKQLPDGTTPIFRGAWEICQALDMGFKTSDISKLVKEKGLPAFRAPGKKHWYALHLDLMLWKQKEERRAHHE